MTMKLRFLPIIIGLLFLSTDSLHAMEGRRHGGGEGRRHGGGGKCGGGHGHWNKEKGVCEMNKTLEAFFEAGSLPAGLPVTLEGQAFEPAERMIAEHPAPLTTTRKAARLNLIAPGQSIPYTIKIFTKAGGHSGHFEEGTCGPIPAEYKAGGIIQMTFSKTNAAPDEPQFKCALSLK
jgi:hypothetical protein